METNCKICKFSGWDLRLLGCGCTVHARCIPMDIVLDLKEANKKGSSVLPGANNSLGTRCPICETGSINGIAMQPLVFDDIDRAVSLKRDESPSLGTVQHHAQRQNGRKHLREEEDHEIQAESPYLLLSTSNSSISCSGRAERRTGRWTSEESALVDFLVTAFDQGLLPLPHGMKLNDFLGEMLLCKSSRLTKKMKNAKLSTRSFNIGKSCLLFTLSDREHLSKLQENFLASLPSEFIRLVLKENLTKQWRTHFFNICLQVGYNLLHHEEWTASLQEVEIRAKKAEEAVRRLRRRKMGLGLGEDRGASSNFINPNSMIQILQPSYNNNNSNSSSSSINKRNYNHNHITKAEYEATSNANPTIRSSILNSNDQKSRTVSSSEDDGVNVTEDDKRFCPTKNSTTKRDQGRQRLFSTDLSISSVGNQGRFRSFSEDFDALLDVLTEETTEVTNTCMKRGEKSVSGEKPSSGKFSFSEPLLKAVMAYIETKNIPFQHSDLWVLSFSSTGESVGQFQSVDVNQPMLVNAGFASIKGLSSKIEHKFREFGLYSAYFSFEPGKGLPGRAYTSGNAVWESDVNNKDPKLFGRVEGAELYDVKTAVAIPLNTALVGRIVVILYSNENLLEDSLLTRNLITELAKHAPEPKWESAALKTEESGDFSQKMTSSSFQHHFDYAFQPSPFKGLQTTNYSYRPSSMKHSVSRTRTVSGEVNIREDHELADFLDKNMQPASNPASEGFSASSIESKTLRPYFLSFRLLLLRPSVERTSRENEIIGILKQSFIAYLRDHRRDPKELAKLIVKDWVCLKSTYSLQMVETQKNKCLEPEGARFQKAYLPSSQTLPTVMELYKHADVPVSISSNRSQTGVDFNEAQSLQRFVSDSSDMPFIAQSRHPPKTISGPKLEHKRYLQQTNLLDSTHYATSPTDKT